ncbi:hypothetical protein BHE74_00007491, partial [Ensete ventricosum]
SRRVPSSTPTQSPPFHMHRREATKAARPGHDIAGGARRCAALLCAAGIKPKETGRGPWQQQQRQQPENMASHDASNLPPMCSASARTTSPDPPHLR